MSAFLAVRFAILPFVFVVFMPFCQVNVMGSAILSDVFRVFPILPSVCRVFCYSAYRCMPCVLLFCPVYAVCSAILINK
jgi:hypothetical protein